jgi:hypothetical protein
MLDFEVAHILILRQKFAELLLEHCIEQLKFIFKHELKQIASAFHTLVAVIIAIVQLTRVSESLNQSFYHQCDEDHLRVEVKVSDLNMRQEYVSEDISHFVHWVSRRLHLVFLDCQFPSQIFQSLLGSEYPSGMGILETQHQ